MIVHPEPRDAIRNAWNPRFRWQVLIRNRKRTGIDGTNWIDVAKIRQVPNTRLKVEYVAAKRMLLRHDRSIGTDWITERFGLMIMLLGGGEEIISIGVISACVAKISVLLIG